VPRPSRTAEEEHERASRGELQSRVVIPRGGDDDAVSAAPPVFDDDDDDRCELLLSPCDLLSQISDNNALCHYSQGVDLVLSSGFLAFANHAGFLQAVDDAGLPVRGIMGTSAGALAGSLYAAGLTPAQLSKELRRVAPVKYLRPSLRPWRGLASLDGVVERLRDLLPATFEELEMEFAVGVVDASTGRHMVVDSGPLPEAVAASAAIPCVFAPLTIPGAVGGPFADGGVVDRTGLSAWREKKRSSRRPSLVGSSSSSAAAAAVAPLAAAAAATARRERAASSASASSSSSSSTQHPAQHPAALVHLIHRSSQLSGNDDLPEGRGDVLVVRSPRAGVSFFSLGDFDGQRDAARERAAPVAAAAAAAAEAAVSAEACAAEV
jgi:predicted acylesterase/phospholipase RssA